VIFIVLLFSPFTKRVALRFPSTDLYLLFAGDEDADCESNGFSSVERCTSTAATNGVLQVIVQAHEPFTDVDLTCTCVSPTEDPTPAPTPAPTSAPTAGPSTSSPTSAPIVSIVQEKGSAESPGLIIGIAAAVGVVVAGAGLFVFFRRRGQQPKPERGVGGKQAVDGGASDRFAPPPQSTPAAFGDGPRQLPPQQQNPPARCDPDTTMNSEEDYTHHAPPPYIPHLATAATDPSTATEYTAGGTRASSASGGSRGHADAGSYTPSSKDQCRTVVAEAVPVAEVTRYNDHGFSHDSVMTGSSGGTGHQSHRNAIDP